MTTKTIAAASALDACWQGNAELLALLPDTPLIRIATALAVLAHHGQMRTSGECYINHPLRVAVRLRHFGEEAITAGLLHDAVEDSPLTIADLSAYGFTSTTLAAIDAVSKRQGEDYPSAIARACENELGALVKLADNFDNSHPEQIAPLPVAKQERSRAKYAHARVMLCAVIPPAYLALLERNPR